MMIFEYVKLMKLHKLLIVSASSMALLAWPAHARENNTLTEAEKAAGWQLLFDGKTFNGWHNFKQEGINPGWVVEDGAMVNKKHGGDIVTSNMFDWFDLELDYKISETGNSGIIYHCTDKEDGICATGPECQLEDNATADDPCRCGWVYALYKPPIDPATGKELDATKSANHWNHIRLLITPQKCEHYINGVKYFEYVLHSDDWNDRVAKSFFGQYPNWEKTDLGYIGIQGDHPGALSLRNVKIRPIHQ
jgi:hypothetical protein